MKRANKIIFIIPDSKKHGAQNFFSRLHNNFLTDDSQKELIIEDEYTKLCLFFYILRISLYKKVIIFSTVNSNVTTLALKLMNPFIIIIPRLGNTISQELEKNTIKFFVHKFFYYLLIRISKFFIFQSNDMKKDFINFFGISSPNYTVINNGLTFPSSQFKNALPNEELKCLLVGTFKKQKGYDIFLESLPYIKNIDKVKFDICGDGPLLNEFKQKLSLTSFNSLISFHGFINPRPFYKEANIYLLPSIFEGFSNSLIEALSYGLPCIASDCPGANKDVIKENFNGYLFINRNPIDLAEKIDLLINNIKSFSSINIYEDAKSKYNIEHIATQYKNLL